MRVAERLERQSKLLVALPCLNEAATIAKVIRQIPTSIFNITMIDVLVIDDGSSDTTSAEATSAGASVIRFPCNRGVGAAFQAALEFAVQGEYDLMVNIDGDGQFNPDDIPKLVAPIINDGVDMVTASRFIDKDFIPHMPTVKRVGNHMIAWLISVLVGKRFADVSCGFRCYSRTALLKLNLQGKFTYTQETFLDFAVKNIEIREVPVQVQYFPDRKSRVANSIVKYAFNAGKIILRGFRDYFPLRFFWSIAAFFAVPATALAVLFLAHYVRTGYFSGFLFAAFTSAFLYFLASVFFVLGIVADMLDRIRSNQERLLYLVKRNSSSYSKERNQ